MSRPVSPNNVSEMKKQCLPSYVIDAANKLIAENYCDGQSTFKLKELVKEIKLKGVYKDGNLNIEDIYRCEGWDVEYIKPVMYESFEAYFIFRR